VVNEIMRIGNVLVRDLLSNKQWVLGDEIF